MAQAPGGRMLTLEAGRGLAALLVVGFHIDAYYFDSPQYWSGQLLGGVFAFGKAGVQYFFVLSGFIMIWSHWQDLGQPGKIGSFLVKRVIRIYPLLWLSVAIMAVMLLATQGVGQEIRDVWTIGESLLLFGREPLHATNFPSWTLWHENLFYLFCALIIGWPRIGLAAFTGWTGICLVAAALVEDTDSLFYALRPYNCLFALGVASAFLLKARALPAPRAVFLAGLAGFAAMALVDNLAPLSQNVQIAGFGLSSALIVAGGVEAERRGLLTLPAAVKWLGALSYPLYLTHMIVLPVLARAAVIVGAPDWLPAPAAALAMAVACIAAALATHCVYEKPVTRSLRALLGRAERQKPASGFASRL